MAEKVITLISNEKPFPDLGVGGISNSLLKNGEHRIIKCSNCGKSLCDIWITQPDLDVHSEIVASCDYCKDKSFIEEVDGKFHIGITDDSSVVNVDYDFIDGPAEQTGIYQKLKITTKRLK